MAKAGSQETWQAGRQVNLAGNQTIKKLGRQTGRQAIKKLGSQSQQASKKLDSQETDKQGTWQSDSRQAIKKLDR